MPVQRTVGSHWVARLIPPRPTFDTDATEVEREIMGRHAGYWSEVAETGRIVVYGPVHDGDGAWGLCVFAADDELQARALGSGDPAVIEGLMRLELGPMAVTLRPG